MLRLAIVPGSGVTTVEDASNAAVAVASVPVSSPFSRLTLSV
jgi:hypothetical protein